MKLPYQVLYDLTDAQANFEKLQAHGLADDTGLTLAITGSTRKVAFGLATVNFATSVSATTLTVTHKLGTTPLVVVATPSIGTTTAVIAGYPNTFAAATFKLDATSSAALNQNLPFYWVAIG